MSTVESWEFCHEEFLIPMPPSSRRAGVRDIRDGQRRFRTASECLPLLPRGGTSRLPPLCRRRMGYTRRADAGSRIVLFGEAAPLEPLERVSNKVLHSLPGKRTARALATDEHG